MSESSVAIITGAASGLGEATAELLADQGWAIVGNDLGTDPHGSGNEEEPLYDTIENIKGGGGTAVASFGDVTNPDYITSLVEETYEEFGRIDGVINYAGFLRDSMVFSMSDEDWETVVDVHLRGHFNLLREMGKHWRERYENDEFTRQRSFLTVSSEAALGTPGQTNYSAAKAGVLGMTRTTARELNRYNVRVNSIMPAAKTRLVRTMPDEMVDAVPDDLTPDKVAKLPAALMTDEAEDITGWTFGIGGDTVYTITDPTFDRSATMQSGWETDSLVQVLDDLIAERPRKKTYNNGMYFVE